MGGTIEFLIFLSICFYLFQLFITIDNLKCNRYKNKKEFLLSLIPFIWIIFIPYLIFEGILDLLTYIKSLYIKFKNLQ